LSLFRSCPDIRSGREGEERLRRGGEEAEEGLKRIERSQAVNVEILLRRVGGMHSRSLVHTSLV
jgi:hypothetical protein